MSRWEILADRAAGGGLYRFLAGAIFAFVASLVDAWVLPFEIRR
jgi:hypothetical protein